jgi:hypothetical protein
MSTFRQQAIKALYEGSLADVGDRNPNAGRRRSAFVPDVLRRRMIQTGDQISLA